MKFLNFFRRTMNDPVEHCDVYRLEGCAHVDGYLCDFEKCDIRLGWAEKKNLGIKIAEIRNSSGDLGK